MFLMTLWFTGDRSTLLCLFKMNIQQAAALAASKAKANSKDVPPTEKAALTVYTYSKEKDCTTTFSDANLLPGIPKGALQTIGRIQEGPKAFRGGKAYVVSYKEAETLVNTGPSCSIGGFRRLVEGKVDPTDAIHAFYLCGLLKSRHIVSGLTLDGVDLAQVAQVLRADWPSAMSKKPPATFALVQPETKEVKANIATFSQMLGLKINHCAPKTQKGSYTEALNAYAADQKKEGCVLWLQSHDWSNPTGFFYPNKPQSFADIVLDLSLPHYPIVVVCERETWLSTIPEPQMQKIKQLYHVSKPHTNSSYLPDRDKRSCFILEARMHSAPVLVP